MENKEYTQFLTDKDKLKISFTQHRGKIVKFVVQYYAFIETRWRPIMRIDNCHGFSHRHVYHLRNREYKVSLEKEANVAFTEAKVYIVRNFAVIKENFLFSG